MKLIDLIVLSFRNLWRRKLRTFLTVLGVIIGTSSIVVMISLGLAMNKAMMDSLGDMGSLNIINVSRSWSSYDDEDSAITDEKIASIQTIPGVTLVSPLLNVDVKLGSGRYYAWANVQGIDLAMLELQGVNLKWGDFPDGSDRYGLVFGSSVAYQFYKPGSDDGFYGYYMGGDMPEPDVDIQNDPIKMSYDMSYGEQYSSGQKQARPVPITVSGEIDDDTGNYSYYIYTDMATALKMYEEKQKYEKSVSGGGGGGKKEAITYDEAIVYVADIDDVSEVQQSIKDMGLEAYSMIDILEEISTISNGVQLVLGGIGAVSLFVAALGITNTMIMSIYERTKEIGVMKVIGASLPDIRKMFLFEAAMIGFVGGFIGLGFSAGISAIINAVGGGMMAGMGAGGETMKASIVPLWLYLSAFLFSGLVGLISGYFPARRAMKLSVLGALRNE